MNAAILHDAEIAIQDERSRRLFGECEKGHGLLECGFCPVCQPAEHARSLELAREVERVEAERRRKKFEEDNRPNAELAARIEQRPDASRFRSLVRALRNGTSSYEQQRLARALCRERKTPR